jgi:hypothetical protein
MMPGMPGMPGLPGMPGMGGSGRTAMTAGAQTPITVGSITAGQLAPGDISMSNGTFADDYSVMLTAGVPVTVVLRGGPSTTMPGSNLDVYLILMQNGVEVEHDDDSAGNLNSRIVFTPPATGMYTLRATTFSSSNAMGSYTLQVMPGANPLAS